MILPESGKLLLAASGRDTVKLFDISLEPQNPCVLTHTPSPGLRVNSVKWNHNNLVLASAGEDGKISLWKKNGQSLWMEPAKNVKGEIVEPSESISTISFGNKGSRYLCSGGTGQVVRIWDLQNKRCVKWLKGHTDTITGAMYNCKDEHIASVSRKGDLLLHNLASGTRAAELKDPNGQVLGALDYSRISRHLLVTAGDDGSIHLWDSTGRSPKCSWLKQHSAPTSAVSFSPSNDKIIASVGLDMKLYTFDSGSRKPSSCIPYEAPFSSLAFTDDGLTLAAGTNTGQVVFYDVRGKPQPITVLRAYGISEAVTNLCWQRSKPVKVNENNCTDDTVLLAGDVRDSVLMPDPLPSRTSSSLSMSSMVSGSRNLSRPGSGNLYSLPASEETPLRSSLVTGGSLSRLQSPRGYNFKDDMDVFSPIVEVQPITTPYLDKLWEDRDGPKIPSFMYASSRFGLSEDRANDNHSLDWKSNSLPKQDDISSSYSQLTPTTSSTHTDDSSSVTPPEAWGGERLTDKFNNNRQSINASSRFATLTSSTSSGLMFPGLQDRILANQSTASFTPGLSLTSLQARETLNQEGSLETISSPLGISRLSNFGSLSPALSLPRRLSSYEERISTAPSFSDALPFPVGSSKSKKTGAETREELINSLLSRSEMTSATIVGTGAPTITNGGMATTPRAPSEDYQQGNSFTLQLFQRTLEETLASFQNSFHNDMRNLHIDTLRQFHMQEMETSRAMGVILENQTLLMDTLEAVQKEVHQLHQSL